jgi:glycosyltransferase involved in cell wall biosynthesis
VSATAVRSRTVLAWPAYANREVNPYNAQLYDGVAAAGWTVREFSWRRALLERHDVWHVHWPEDCVNQRDGVRSLLRLVAFLAAIVQSKLTGRRLVWTVHNLKPHESRRPRLQRLFRAAFLRGVDQCIALTQAGRDLARASYPQLATTPFAVVPHGHYRDAYPVIGDRAAARRRFDVDTAGPVYAFVGLVRPYKNVPGLLKAFRALADPAARLLVAGLCVDAALQAQIEALAREDDRVRLRLAFLDDREMAEAVAASDCVVLPYTEILNSGVALLALSLGRPVVVPARGALSELAARCGPAWALAFEGDFGTVTLEHARAELLGATAIAARGSDAPAWIDHLAWPVIGQQTVATYDAVVERRAAMVAA